MTFYKVNKCKCAYPGASSKLVIIVFAVMFLIFVTFKLSKSDLLVPIFSDLIPYRLNLSNQTGFDIIYMGLTVKYYGGISAGTFKPAYDERTYHLPNLAKGSVTVFTVPNPKPIDPKDIIELVYISGKCTNRLRIPSPEISIKQDYYFELKQLPACFEPKKKPVMFDYNPLQDFINKSKKKQKVNNAR